MLARTATGGSGGPVLLGQLIRHTGQRRVVALEQRIVQGFVTGEVGQMPAGPLSMVVGA